MFKALLDSRLFQIHGTMHKIDYVSSSAVKSYWKVVFLLLLAVAMRVGYLDIVGHNDLDIHHIWAVSVWQNGLPGIYAQNFRSPFNYPPVYLVVLALINQVWSPAANTTIFTDPQFLLLHKWFPVFAEILLIAVVYRWLQKYKRLQWIIAGLLAIYPGLIITSAFWGQIDSIMTLFMVLSLVMLNRNRPRLAWFFFGLALLTKFPAILLFPILLILTFRRNGIRETFIALLITVISITVVLFPFVMGSGFQNAIRPFANATDVEPATTAYAYNLWYTLIPGIAAARPALVYDAVPNTLTLYGLTYRQIGLLLLGFYSLLICFDMWRRPGEKREFVWASAIYCAFFLLPTQVHERYLYPAAIFLLIAIAQDRRLWPVALGIMFTFSYNVVVPTHAPFYWFGVNILFLFGDITLHVALLNLLLFVVLTWIALTDIVTVPLRAYLRQLRIQTRLLIGFSFAAAVVLATLILFPVIVPPTLPVDARSLDVRFDDTLRLEGYHLVKDGNVWDLTLYWQADRHNNNDYTIFVHATRGGQIIAQKDEKPDGGLAPVWRWFYHRLIITTYQLEMSDQPDTIFAGMYNAQTLTNVSLIQNGQFVADGRAVICTNECR